MVSDEVYLIIVARADWQIIWSFRSALNCRCGREMRFKQGENWQIYYRYLFWHVYTGRWSASTWKPNKHKLKTWVNVGGEPAITSILVIGS